ncbi:MAG: MBL fold metallo-hydrolase [Nanoarchaeota archaeon]|nr:MBL fold metallo-hydrolase [Nanoarchaeota archaeon]
MEVSALASGSSGNCFYIKNNKSSILVDAGISCKQIETRLEKLGESPEKIKGIFITHEHGDHIRGADVFARKFKVPIFATSQTIDSKLICSDSKLIREMKNNQIIKIANLKVKSFSKSHKAVDPVSFCIKGDKKIAVITDLGFICENTQTAISKSDAIFIEANHDIEMLSNGPYPAFLKRWISGDTGHLSNEQALDGILNYASKNLKTIILSHLSEKNNCPKIAAQTFQDNLNSRKDLSPQVIVSEKFEPTSLIKV